MSRILPPGLARTLLALTLGSSAAAPRLAADDAVRWRGDYNAARAEAREKNAPLVVVVGTDDCIYCRKQDATTFRDPALADLLNRQAVIVKVNGGKEPAFVQALKIQIYPTTVIAAPDGKIVSFLQGYVTADQLRDHVKSAVIDTIATPEWATRDLAEGDKALRLGDATRAFALWKTIAAGVPESPVRAKAEAGVASVEKAAGERLTRGQQLEARRDVAAAVEVYSDLIRNFAGTTAAVEATTRLTAFAARGEGVDRLRVMIAKEYLTTAREDFRRERLADCLDRCEQIGTQFPDLPEGREAAELKASIQGDPDRFAVAAEQFSVRVAELQLSLAEGWVKKGQTGKAAACLERVALLAPNSRTAEVAGARLTSLRKPGVPGMTTSLQKAP